MKNGSKLIKEFFVKYEDVFNTAMAGQIDVEATASEFADCFVAATPQGVTCGRNDDQFRKVIPQGYEFYKSIGTEKMNIISNEITELDDFHFMNKVHWKASYSTVNNRNAVIEFNVIYFLQILNDRPKIFAYITGDEQSKLREAGLIPDQN